MATEPMSMQGRNDRPLADRAGKSREKPRLGPPRVVVRGAWGRALPAPKPGEREESIFTSWLMGLLGKPYPNEPD